MKAIILFFGDPNVSEESDKLKYYQVINMVNTVDTRNLSVGSDIKIYNVYRELVTRVITAPPEVEVTIKGHQTDNNINFKKLSRLFWKLAKKQQKAQKEE